MNLVILRGQRELTVPRLYFPHDGVTDKAKLERAGAVDGTDDKVYFGKLSTKTKSTDRLLIFGQNAGPLSGLIKLDWRAMGKSKSRSAQ